MVYQKTEKLGLGAPLPEYYSDSDSDSEAPTDIESGYSQQSRSKKKRRPSTKKKYTRISYTDRIIATLNPYKDDVTWQRALVAITAEFICTFLFVFFATAAVVSANFVGQTQNLIIAFGQGFSLALAVYLAAPISGGHLNPAVTISFFIVGRISLFRGIGYVIAQFVGAIAASGVLRAIIKEPFAGALGATSVSADITIAGAFFLEVLMTFLLVFVLFGTAVDPASGVGKMAPLAVGLVVIIDVLIGVQWTGASMNPARTLGPQLVSGNWNHYWLYFFAPLTGALLAAILYELYMRIRPYEPPSRTKLSGLDSDGENKPKGKQKTHMKEVDNIGAQ